MQFARAAAVVAAASAFAAPATAHAGWAPAFDVSAPGGGATGRSNAVVAAPGGRFVVAWAWGAHASGAPDAVQARRIGHRGAGRRLTLAAGAAAVDDVRLWPGPGGRTVATWSAATRARRTAIRMRTISAHDRLGRTVTITEPSDDGAGVVAVPRADGSTTVAWIDTTGAQTSVVKARRVSATGARGPVSLVSAAGGRASELVGAADIDDGALLVWNAGGTITGRRVSAAGAAARPPFQISGQGQTAAAPQLATDGTGGATVLWVQRTAPASIQEVAVIADDKLSGVEQLSAPGVASSAPSMAFGNGFGVTVWAARTPATAVVAGLDADGQRTTLSRPSRRPASLRPDAAIDGSGHGFAVWQRDLRSGAVVQATRFGGTRAPRARTLARAPGGGAFPHIAAGPGGRALAIWVQTRARVARVEAARYRVENRRSPR